MSSLTSAISGLLTTSFHGHGHRRGSLTSSTGSAATGASSNSIGQLPIGASTALFGGMVQSFEQTLGAASSAAATQPASMSTTVASAPAATPAQGQKLQAFEHSLVQALKQDGLTSNSTGNVAASLQNLIQQLGPNGKPTAATETLTSTFQNLVNGFNGSASSSTSTGGSSNAGLQSFLNNLLQKVQASGTASFPSTGSNINTQV